MRKKLLALPAMLLVLLVCGGQPIEHLPLRPNQPGPDKHNFGVEVERLVPNSEIARVANNIERVVFRLEDAAMLGQRLEEQLKWLTFLVGCNALSVAYLAISYRWRSTGCVTSL